MPLIEGTDLIEPRLLYKTLDVLRISLEPVIMNKTLPNENKMRIDRNEEEAFQSRLGIALDRPAASKEVDNKKAYRQ